MCYDYSRPSTYETEEKVDSSKPVNQDEKKQSYQPSNAASIGAAVNPKSRKPKSVK